MKKLLPLLLLCACTPEGKANLRSALTGEPTPQRVAQMERAKRQYCADMGAPEGSANYFECRMALDHHLMAAQSRRPSFNDVGNAALMGVAHDTYIAP